MVQNGQVPDFALPLKDMGSGVTELRVDSGKNTYRIVYIAKLRLGVFVLHAFLKKSKTGRAIPGEIKRTILARLKVARGLTAELRE